MHEAENNPEQEQEQEREQEHNTVIVFDIRCISHMQFVLKLASIRRDSTTTANTDPLTQLGRATSFETGLSIVPLFPAAAIEKLEVHRDCWPQGFAVIDIVYRCSISVVSSNRTASLGD
jgi:hypothetical protein